MKIRRYTFYCSVDCEQSLLFLCTQSLLLLHAKPKHARGEAGNREKRGRKRRGFGIALDEVRTRRILREKADCKQSNCSEKGYHAI